MPFDLLTSWKVHSSRSYDFTLCSLREKFSNPQRIVNHLISDSTHKYDNSAPLLVIMGERGAEEENLFVPAVWSVESRLF